MTLRVENLMKAGQKTLVETAMETVRHKIAQRILLPGAKLPSIRTFSKTTGLSKSTIVEAYERLAAEGLIRARQGSGFYVTASLAPLSLAEIEPKRDRAIDPFWVSRQSLEAKSDVLKPGCGWLPADWMADSDLRQTLKTLSRTSDDGVLTDYASPLGLAPLRQLLSLRFGRQNVNVSPDHILLTDSGTQAIDLVCRFLIEPGDCVLVDDPCYFNFHALLRAHRAKIVSVPYTPQGPDLACFAEALTLHRPRLYITNSGPHNPTGAILAPAVAHRLLRLAEEHDLLIIEDDIFTDFELEPSVRLAAFDGLERVIAIGSFSKTLSASVRCGYIATQPDWIEGLIDLKIATGFGASRLSSEIVYAALKSGRYRKHMDDLRRRLAKSVSLTLGRLQMLGIEPWSVPQAGMFLWCQLPGDHDATEIARQALADNIVLAPGNVFSVQQSAGNFMRFNAAQCQDPRLFHFLAKALG